MFDYVEDKAFLSRMRNLCGEIMQDCCHYLKEDYDIGAIFYLVGSGAKNLIVQNASLSIDLDYNLEIVRCEDFEDYQFPDIAPHHRDRSRIGIDHGRGSRKHRKDNAGKHDRHNNS